MNVVTKTDISKELAETREILRLHQSLPDGLYLDRIPAPSEPWATVVLDSVSPAGIRLTTFEVKMHRFVLAEFNTHRVFSRNAASSRAIPIEKIIRMVLKDPAEPVFWGRNQSGMQAAEELTGDQRIQARIDWYRSRDSQILWAIRQIENGLHKQLTNRLLEPWMWVTDVVSSTRLAGFFHQRSHFMAQPEIRAASDSMKEALSKSTPRLVDYDSWHLPYILRDEQELDVYTRRVISVARCARVSYMRQGNVGEYEDDYKLFERLVSRGPDSDDPMHLSPPEHVARPEQPWTRRLINTIRQKHYLGNSTGNFHGWIQLRSAFETDVYRR